MMTLLIDDESRTGLLYFDYLLSQPQPAMQSGGQRTVWNWIRADPPAGLSCTL